MADNKQTETPGVVSRRDMFQILGVVPAAAVVTGGDHAHVHMAPQTEPAAKGARRN